MTQVSNQSSDQQTIPAGIVRRKRSLSIVWLVPITALLISIWLAYNAISSQGPTVEIQFQNADGLEAGKTKVKYKNVEVGLVKSIHLDSELSKVLLQVQFEKEMAPYLTDRTRFWVVRARVGTSEISGLGTLLSGAYLGMDPIDSGNKVSSFIGLESPPVVTMDTQGRFYNLKADNLGSLHEGSPVYFRRIQVGHLVSYKLPAKGKSVDIKIFIKAPHHKKVFSKSRFWNAGGLEVNVSSSGVQLNTESLVSLLAGGIAFENVESFEEDSPAAENAVFRLYPNRAKIDEPRYVQQEYNILKFRENIRGLSVGASVEFRGYKIGEVVDIKLEFSEKDNKDIEFLSSVLIVTEPQRIMVEGVENISLTKEEIHQLMIKKGLRAQLQVGMLLTGKLFIDLDFFPEAPPVTIDSDGPYMEIPTISNSIEQLPQKLMVVFDQLARIPYEQIGNETLQTISNINRITASKELQGSPVILEKSLENLESLTQKLNDFSKSDELSKSLAAVDNSVENIESFSRRLNSLAGSKELTRSISALEKSLENLSQLTEKLNQQLADDLSKTLVQGEKALMSVEQTLGENSSTMVELNQTLRSLAEAADSVRELAEYLERNPNSLIYGKGGN